MSPLELKIFHKTPYPAIDPTCPELSQAGKTMPLFEHSTEPKSTPTMNFQCEIYMIHLCTSLLNFARLELV